MKKVLLINSCQGLYGGIESFLLNIFNSLSPAEFDVTFLTCGKTTYDMYRNDIENRGGHIDEIPIFADTLSKQVKLYKALKEYYSENQPDIVHINSGGLSFHYLASRAAKAVGIKTVILHSHNFIPEKSGFKEKLKNVMKRQVARYGDVYLACSTGAARWIFPENLVDSNSVEIIPNGIDTVKFAYSLEKRQSFRNEFGIGNELLIGNIGRFQEQKNHPFMLKIMAEVIKKSPDAKLMLAGEGELRKTIEEQVVEYGLAENIIFLGERNDMDRFFSAMDVFILPSLHEGLPFAAIEAQASGTTVLLADTVTVETNVTGNVSYLPIFSDGSEFLWAEAVLKELPREDYRHQQNKIMRQSPYNVEVCCQMMRNIYLGVQNVR
ncbi:TPA: glycosyltransferase [Streptococcus suis]|nr:glycosyltransferase [Streptococcus suis]HEM6534436.1 glycosyltransferase [Streptococcus suis]